VQGDFLYDAVDFILNNATENELEVIRAALKRRVEGSRIRGPMGVDPARLARESAAHVREQLGFSMERIRAMVKDMATEILRKNAPELTEKQLEELLDAWVPDREAPAASGGQPGAAATAGSGGLPAEALLAMIARFISYGTQTMSVSEQIALQNQTPDWQKRYWERFSPRVRQLVSLYLNGQLDKPTFWERTKAELGMESEPPLQGK
jgi:hypothetical protein